MSIITSTYNGYPVEFDGQWMKVFSHYSGGGEFFSTANDWDEAKWSNPGNPSANKYSIMAYIKNFRFDGKYTFKLVYPQYPDRNNIWSQAQNPLDIMEVVDNVVKIETGWNNNYWNGLTRSSQTGTTFLDGSNPHGNWYFAVASASSWSGATNFPGPGVPVNRAELWIKATGDDMKAVYHKGDAAVPSNVEAKAQLGEWSGYGSEPVARTSMVGLPTGAGRDLQVWANDGVTPRFYSAASNAGQLKHIASQLAGTTFETPGDAISWLNANAGTYHLHNEDLYPTVDGLWASYDFANPDSFKNDGRLYDLSGQNRHGWGGTHDVEDVQGVMAYYFRSVERFWTPVIGSLGTGDCTLESMIYADANELTSGDRGTIIQSHIYMSWNKSNQRLSSYWYSTDNQGYHEPSQTLNRNQWYHLTTVWDFDAGQLKQYIDGVLVNTVTTRVVGGPGYIGGLNIGMESESRQFSGAIAIANIYKKALSSAEVLRNYEYYSKRIR
mgnify:CR=1 FL=1